MSDDEDTIEKADREKREFTDRAIEQIAKTQNVTPFMFTRGTTYDDAIAQLASSLARVEQTLSRNPSSYDSRDLVIDDLIDRVHRQSRRIDSLELDIVALRSSQQPADPTGVHPYRSSTQRRGRSLPKPPLPLPLPGPAAYLYPSEAPSSPVVTSETLGRVEGRPGVMRRGYGALERSWPAAVMAPVLGVTGYACWLAGENAVGASFGAWSLATVALGIFGFVQGWRGVL